jgi:hypothetical protein
MRLIVGSVAVLVIGTSAQVFAAPPGWVGGKDARYSPQEYLVGVGKGPKQESADLDARAEISRIFESKIQSVMEDFQGAASTVNGAGKGVSVEVQSIAQLTKVTTAKTLKGVELRERGSDGGTFYTLGLLDRNQCITSLTEEIEALDQKINAAAQSAESAGGDKLKAFKAWGQALNFMDERESLNAMLRVCDKRGKGIPATMSIGDIAAKFDEASGNFHLGLDLQGSGAERVRDCLMEALGNKGYQIEVIEIEDEDSEEEDEDVEGGNKFDAILKGTMKSAKAGEVAGSILVRTDVTIKLINGKTKKILKTFTGNRKEGRRDVKSSAALSAHKICMTEAPKIANAIDQYFKR